MGNLAQLQNNIDKARTVEHGLDAMSSILAGAQGRTMDATGVAVLLELLHDKLSAQLDELESHLIQ